MKTVYMVGGTMGIGKTTVCQQIKNQLNNSVFLDGDWCWDSHPFQVTDETKKMVMHNICFLLNQFIHCSAYENIIFCWVMHEQAIVDTILANIDKTDCSVKIISLVGSEENLRRKLMKDVAAGKRTEDVIERSISRIPNYQELDSVKICTDGKTPQEIADEIIQLSPRIVSL